MKNITLTTLIAAGLLAPLQAEDAAKANYGHAQTKSDALETQGNQEQSQSTQKVNLLETAEKSGSHDTFVTAVKAAGLTDYATAVSTNATVFAPNDEAFEALPEGTLEALLQPENKDRLISILKYHILPERTLAADVEAIEYVTLNGDTFTVVKTEDGKVMINDANVVAVDMEANNGVIHTIDAVIIPPES